MPSAQAPLRRSSPAEEGDTLPSERDRTVATSSSFEKGLVKKRVRAQRHGLFPVPGLPLGRQEKHGQCTGGRPLAQVAQDVEPRAPRQHHVEHEDVGIDPVDLGQRGFALAMAKHLPPVA